MMRKELKVNEQEHGRERQTTRRRRRGGERASRTHSRPNTRLSRTVRLGKSKRLGEASHQITGLSARVAQSQADAFALPAR